MSLPHDVIKFTPLNDTIDKKTKADIIKEKINKMKEELQMVESEPNYDSDEMNSESSIIKQTSKAISLDKLKDKNKNFRIEKSKNNEI